MTVKQRTWRFASLLAVTLLVGTTSAAQAGVIPWVYDAVFGPVRYPASSYRYSASYAPAYYVPQSGYAPVSYRRVSSSRSSGCSPCSTSYYAPVIYAPSYGYGDGCDCRTVAVAPSCGPCGVACSTPSSNCDSGCSPSTPTRDAAPQPRTRAAEPNGTTNGFHPTRKAPEANHRTAPKEPTQTFVTPSNRSTTDVEAPTSDGLEPRVRTPGPRTDDALEDQTNETRKPVPPPKEIEETVIPKVQKAPIATDDLEGDGEVTPPNTTEPNKKSDGEAKIQLPLPQLNFDDKIAWRAEAPRTRVSFHAKTAKVSVARRVPSFNSDWTPVVAKPKSTQLVKK